MNLYKVFVLAIVLLFTNACVLEKDCGGCVTAPEELLFELVDANSGENLLSSGLYKSSVLELFSSEKYGRIEVVIKEYNGKQILVLNSVGWKTEKINYELKIQDRTAFTLFVDAERVIDQCCSFTVYNHVNLENCSFKKDPSSGIYKILID